MDNSLHLSTALNIPSLASPKEWSKTANAYFYAFVLATLLCFSPSKLLAYFAPMIVITIFFLVTGKSRVLRQAFLLPAVGICIVILYFLLIPRFAIVSAFIQFLTYSAFIVVVAIDHRYLRSPLLYNRIESFISWVALIQSLVGIVQALYSFLNTGTFDINSGDAVAGTISMSLLPDGTLSNYMFAVNLAFILLFLTPTVILKQKSRSIVIFTGLTLILASVLHVMIFLSISFALGFLLCRPALPKGWIRILAIIVGAGFIIAAATLLSTNWSLLPRLVQGVTSGEYPRGRAYERVFGVMLKEYPLMPVTGLGPGQFASRAAAMASGYYLGGIDNPRGLPLLPQSMSKPFQKYLLDLWFQSKNSAGSTSQPFSSWLATYTEFGGIVAFCITIAFIYQLFKVLLLAIRTKQRWQGTCVCAAMLFVFFLGFQDVYWEIPQAILIGLMLIKIMHSKLTILSRVVPVHV